MAQALTDPKDTGLDAVLDAGPVPGTPAGVLADVRRLRVVRDLADATILARACEWADLHPVRQHADDSGTDGAYDGALEGAFEEALEAVDVPDVAWDAPAEFALALGLPHDAGVHLIRDALELRHRLPRIWARVQEGTLPVWRARRIAQRTMRQASDVAAHLDRALAEVAHRVGPTTLTRLLDEAQLRLHPEEHEQQRLDHLHDRHAHLYTPEGVGGTGYGIASMDIRGDLEDLLDFDHALSEVAARLAEHGDPDSLDVRRARAVGILADPEAAQTLLSHDVDDAETGRSAGGSCRPRKELVLHLHLSEWVLHGGETVGRCQIPGVGGGTGVPVLEEAIREWCGRADNAIKVLPVLDLNDHDQVGAYEIPDRLKTRVGLRDGHCIFPFCPVPARRCDHDHGIPHGWGGMTCDCNLATLCRRHHRLKTHTRWRYRTIEPGVYRWTAPYGAQYLRDHHGTRELAPDFSSPPDQWDGCHRPEAHPPQARLTSR